MSSKIPEVALVIQIALRPLVPYFSQKLNITGGFGQWKWTEEVTAKQLKERSDYLVDMENAMKKGSGKQQSLQSLSNALQTTLRIPHGVLIQADQRWLSTTVAAYWKFGDEERKTWCLRMNQKLFDAWNALASPVSMLTPNKNVGISMEGVERVAMHIMRFPGQIFALRTGPTKSIHHPSCRTIEKSFGDPNLQWKDLLAAGNPMEPDMDLWGALQSIQCCGQVWKTSYLHWARGECTVPPTLRLMTLGNPSKLFEYITQQVIQLEEDYTIAAVAAHEVLKSQYAGLTMEYLRRERVLADRIYQGDMFQPKLFINLCAKFNLREP
jgi:hypothetical protein